MKHELRPWEIHRALTRERLRHVGRLIWDARMSAAEDARRDIGDKMWDIGCKAFSRTIHAVATAAKDLDVYPYLSVKNASNHFVFAIGGVPVRFYRGEADQDAPEKFASADDDEKLALQLAFELEDTPTPSSIFRFVVEADRFGFPTAVKLAQVEEDGTVTNPWTIDLDGPSDVIMLIDEPVTPPVPTVGDEREEQAREASEESADEETKGA